MADLTAAAATTMVQQSVVLGGLSKKTFTPRVQTTVRTTFAQQIRVKLSRVSIAQASIRDAQRRRRLVDTVTEVSFTVVVSAASITDAQALRGSLAALTPAGIQQSIRTSMDAEGLTSLASSVCVSSLGKPVVPGDGNTTSAPNPPTGGGCAVGTGCATGLGVGLGLGFPIIAGMAYAFSRRGQYSFGRGRSMLSGNAASYNQDTGGAGLASYSGAGTTTRTTSSTPAPGGYTDFGPGSLRASHDVL